MSRDATAGGSANARQANQAAASAADGTTSTVVGAPSTPGLPVPTDAFADHVLGVALLNDWSARDVQAFEYRPLGPFLGKSFATSLSGWVTPLAALEAARVPLPGQDPPPPPHLAVEEPAGYDIDLEVVVDGEVVSRPPYAATYVRTPSAGVPRSSAQRSVARSTSPAATHERM